VSGARTEQPTPRRLEQARRRGQVARSGELQAAVALGAGLLALSAHGPRCASELAVLLQSGLVGAGGDAPPLAVVGAALRAFVRAAGVLLLVPAAAAGAVGLFQTGGLVAPGAIGLRLDRLDPVAGARRLLSGDAPIRAALGLAKAALAAALLHGWFGEHGRTLTQLPRLEPPSVMRSIAIGSLAVRLALAALCFGAVDLALARRRHRSSLRMTREELLRESKEDEGDPRHRSERRRLHRALLEAGPVASATVVVVNPTHVAVALLHRRELDEAPRVLAKGTGEGAARIRSIARRSGIPIVKDVALARALFRLAEAGEEIPAELYDAAAAVLLHVYGPSATEPT
jgi:type III secretion protein U